MSKILLTIICLGFFFSSFAQETFTNKEASDYRFEMINDVEATAVKDQGKSGTCWSFATASFFESELLKAGKGRHFLSPMYVVRKVYFEKAKKYVRMHGKFNFSAGGEPFDIPFVYRNYGMVPNEVYSGLPNGSSSFNQFEMDAVLKGMLDALIKNPGGKLSKNWKKAVNSVLDVYLGKAPENFTYKGKEYTPKSYAKTLGLDMDDYVSVTSFTHHPFYEKFIIEIPDNWQLQQAYNIPLDEMMNVIDKSLKEGHSIAWAADVSEDGFSFQDGLALVPKDPSTLNKMAKDSEKEEKYAFREIVPQKEISQKLRQEGFDDYSTTDDHSMQITGKVKDQEGNIYYKVKNSWGSENYNKGYFYASSAYVKYKTVFIYVNKVALTKGVQKKLEL